MDYDKEFFLELLEHLNLGIFVLDAKGNYLYVNTTYLDIVNETSEFYDNMSIPKLKEMGYITLSVWEQILQKKAPVVALVTITDKKRNRIYRCFTSGIPSFNNDGSIKYIFYLVENISNMNERIQAGVLNQQNYHTGLNVDSETPSIDIIAESPKMKDLIKLLNIVSKTDASILITGPTGSGKEVMAEYSYRKSTRSKGPYISVDCASIPEALLESELFGYETGAFTGASTKGKIGQIELANGGTLFLDEINSIPLGLQSKLLRVLETRKVKRLGANESRPIDFRLICASNESLEMMVKNGSFRSDLYYRINVVPIHISPLRERKEDIAPLALYFLQNFCKKYSRIKILSEHEINALLSYDWPGNVRELKNFIERLVVTSPDIDLQIETVPNRIFEDVLSKNKPFFYAFPSEQINLPFTDGNDFSYRLYMEQCEKQLIENALAQFKTPVKVAEVLKLDLSNVYRKIRKHQL